MLLHLALELTDLLLAQLVITRRELESSQYRSFTTDLSLDSQNEGTRNNSVDSSLQTENNRWNDNTSRRNADREWFPRIRNMPSTSNADPVEDLLSLNRSNRRFSLMAQQLKRLFHRRSTQSDNNNSSENQNDPVVAAPNNDNNGDDSNYDDNAQNEDNRHSTSEHALSAEVQSIVERIQSSSSFDNDEVRTGIENRMLDAAHNSRESLNLYDSYRRNYRVATVSEPAMRRRVDESRNSQERETGLSNENWRSYVSSSGDEQSSFRSPTQRLRWFAVGGRQNARDPSFERHSLHRYGNSDSSSYSNSPNSRRFLHGREGASLRREFNVPELQVNSVPVNDFDNMSGNRRRHNTPPIPTSHMLPPYVLPPTYNNFVHNTENRNNDRTNESTVQSGSWTGISNNNRNRV